jgi:hypothetical protein
MMRAARVPDSATLGELIDADWEASLHALERGRAPTRWIRKAQAWGKLMEHVTVLAPQTYEQLMSCPCVVDGEHCTIGDAWGGQEAAWKDNRPAGVTGDHIALLQSGATQYHSGLTSPLLVIARAGSALRTCVFVTRRVQSDSACLLARL